MPFAPRKRYESWGRFPKATPNSVRSLLWRSDALPSNGDCVPMLPYGLGRSYGDCCLNDRGMLLDTSGLSRFISFDAQTGLLCCEAGVSFAEILSLFVPRGWFLPVTPGTKFVTVGGAIANDVHGKNHHRAGTFGCHVTRIELLRSGGERFLCSPAENADLFRATIGGLGLTGVITAAKFRLIPISSPWIAAEFIRFGTLDEFFALNIESDRAFDYTVSWLDSFVTGHDLGRGVFIRGNHAPADAAPKKLRARTQFRVPFDAPAFFLNRPFTRLFNLAYYHARLARTKKAVSFDSFFYPLDAVLEWNRLYGRRGFLQYQCVVPYADVLRGILDRIARSGLVSFLAVLKTFGDISSPGMMSFPRPGLTLALDFPNQGEPTLRLLDELDAVVADTGGAVYPAKDARMSPERFEQFFPQWREFAVFTDPAFSSSLWRRVTAGANMPVPAAVASELELAASVPDAT